MPKNVFTVVLFLVTVNCSAQQDHFVKIQAENKQPFYATISGRALTSSDAGYLIISKLRDTVYEIGIAFPQDIWSEQRFSIAIDKKDQSFQLRNIEDKGWALCNTATSEIKFSDKAAAAIAAKAAKALPKKKEDSFSRLMAGVVNDTTVMYTTYVEEEPEKGVANIKSSAKPSTIDFPFADNSKMNLKDSLKNRVASVALPLEKAKVTSNKSDTATNSIRVVKKPLYQSKDAVAAGKKPSFIKRLTEQKNDSSMHLVFVDVLNKGVIDTVDVLIPLDKKLVVTEPAKKEKAKKETAPVTAKKMKQVNDTVQAVVIKNGKENIGSDSLKKDVPRAEEEKIPKISVNKDCGKLATDYDIDKLRIKMLLIENDDDKIIAARNVFRVKCFSVKQVNALSEVFKTDEGKYKLFDAVYDHVSDAGDFIQLQQLLSDPYYINRFKAMIR